MKCDDQNPVFNTFIIAKALHIDYWKLSCISISWFALVTFIFAVWREGSILSVKSYDNRILQRAQCNLGFKTTQFAAYVIFLAVVFFGSDVFQQLS